MTGKMKVPLYRHNLINDDTEMLGNQIGKMLSGMIISTGPINDEVSTMFAKYLHRNHCLLTSSWSTGMTATLMALGIKPGDNVIVPAMTFAATANIVESLGANVIFVDIDPHTKLMDLDATIKICNDCKVKAIIPVHLYGQMIDVRYLRNNVDPSILIIEDAAHAIESQFDDYKPGHYSNAAVFSFYQSKNMTTGEGGAIVTDDEGLYKKIKVVYRHGVDLCGYQRHIREEFIAPDVVAVGIKGNLPDILALLLPPQIKRADETVAKRKEIGIRYMKELDGLVEFPKIVSNCKHAWHIFPVGVNPNIREKILIDLYNNSLNTTVHFRSLPMTQYYSQKYGYKPSDHPNSYLWGESVFSLPVFPGLTYDEQSYVISKLKEAIERNQ